jgi:hypothetical protein
MKAIAAVMAAGAGAGRIAGDRMSTNDLAADVASTDIFDALVDADGPCGCVSATAGATSRT